MSKASRSKSKRFHTLLQNAVELARSQEIRRVLVLARMPLNNKDLEPLPARPSVLLALDARIRNYRPVETLDHFYLRLPDRTPLESLESCLQRAIRLDKVKVGERIVCLFPLANPSDVDTISIICLRQKTEYISLQKVARFSDSVPADVLHAILTLAMEVAREGREGMPIGALFVVGDSQRVLDSSRPMIMNPFHGYPEDERRITNPDLFETTKEIAQIDGAFVIRSDGVILSAGRHIDTSTKGLQVPKGLGARHMAAASISKTTDAIAITISASTRTVRVFRKGKIVLESRPLRGLWV